MPSQLAEAAIRRDEVRGHQRRSLFANAALVFVALAAMLVMVALTRRERRLAAMLQRRVEEGTVATMRAFGAYVEFAPSGEDAMRAVALIAAGATPLLSARMACSGSLTEEARTRGTPAVVTGVDGIERRLPPDLAAPGVCCTGLMAPLLSSGETF